MSVERLQVVIGVPRGSDLCGPHSRARWRKHAVTELNHSSIAIVE